MLAAKWVEEYANAVMLLSNSDYISLLDPSGGSSSAVSVQFHDINTAMASTIAG